MVRERSEGGGWIGCRGHNATFALFVKVVFSVACDEPQGRTGLKWTSALR